MEMWLCPQKNGTGEVGNEEDNKMGYLREYIGEREKNVMRRGGNTKSFCDGLPVS